MKTAEEKLQIVIELENEQQIKADSLQSEESTIDFMIDDMDNINLFIDEDESIDNK